MLWSAKPVYEGSSPSRTSNFMQWWQKKFMHLRAKENYEGEWPSHCSIIKMDFVDLDKRKS